MTALAEFEAKLDWHARERAIALAMARHGLTRPQADALGSPLHLIEVNGALHAGVSVHWRVQLSLFELGLLEQNNGVVNRLSVRGTEIADAISAAYAGLPAAQAIREYRRLSDEDREAREARRERVSDHVQAASQEIGERVSISGESVTMSHDAYAELCRRAGIAVPGGLLD